MYTTKFPLFILLDLIAQIHKSGNFTNLSIITSTLSHHGKLKIKSCTSFCKKILIKTTFMYTSKD